MISNAPHALFAAKSQEWKRFSSIRGLSLLEIVFAMAFSIFLAIAITTSLLTSQRIAARVRLLTNARAIVQRNIDAAAGIAFTSGSIPDILAITSSSGVVCDDDGGSGSPVENIQVLRTGTTALVTGTLTRIVSAEPVIVSGTAADASVLVRRVTFKIDYDYLSLHYTHSETTLRSADLQ